MSILTYFYFKGTVFHMSYYDEWHSTQVEKVIEFYANQSASLVLSKEWLERPKEERKTIDTDTWAAEYPNRKKTSTEALEGILADLYHCDRPLFRNVVNSLTVFIELVEANDEA